MANCTSCGSSIPDGQGRSCSMCYGDIGHGRDGYYFEWALEQERKAAEIDAAEQAEFDAQVGREDVDGID